jgi:hypothetical protein
VKRAGAVAAAAALTAGLAATFAALAGRPAPAGIDPQQAVLDGCGRDYSAQVRREIPTWVYVNDHGAPATGPPPPQQRLEGVVSSRYFPQLASHPTEEDLPTVHRAYDFNFDVLPDRAYRGLLGGDPAAHTGNFEGKGASSGRIHVEREQTALPSFAWPEPGDRVAMIGSWIWDCGHWLPGGERTEIHSYRALWVARSTGGEGDLVVSNDKTYAGVEADCAHRAKLVIPLFQSCLSTESRWADVRGTYRFRLNLPPRPSRRSRVRVRVVDMGSSQGTLGARAIVHGRTVEVTLPVLSNPARRLTIAQRVLAGWTGAPRPEHLRVRFVRLLVRRAMDPGCPNGRPTCGSKETTHGEQGSKPPGEWNVYLEAAGKWTTWGSGLLRTYDGQVFRNGPAIDVFVPRGRPWRVFAFARECDFGSFGNADGAGHAMTPCPRSSEYGSFADGDDRPGVIVKRFASPAASLGFHRGRPLKALSTCPAVNKLGCYELDYVVTRVR